MNYLLKKKIHDLGRASLVFAIIMSISVHSMAVDAQGIVRGFVWGVSLEDVKNFETARLLETYEGALFYRDTIEKRDVLISYEFADNKLWRVRLDYQDDYSDPQEYIRLLLDLQMMLEGRFGQATKENFLWHNDRERNFPQHWGHAVLRRDLDITIFWDLPETHVRIDLHSDETFQQKLSITFVQKPENSLRPSFLGSNSVVNTE